MRQNIFLKMSWGKKVTGPEIDNDSLSTFFKTMAKMI